MSYAKYGALALFAAAIGATALLAKKAEEKEKKSNNPRKVIIDTDCGADDLSAIILAAKSPELDILGITVMAGNVELDQAAVNALMAAELSGKDIPVYKGASETYGGKKINAYSVFGSDGMGDMDLIHPQGHVQDKPAVDYILDTINEYPGEVEIVAIGPATNIAYAMDRDPETMKKVKMIWSMGTAGLGSGNASPVAEFNVYSDVPAYKRMLDFGVPITIIGLDMCAGKAMWNDSQFNRLSLSGKTGRFITESFTKLREFYRSNGSACSVMNCDSLAMMCVIDPEFVTDTARCHCSCIAQEGETYGQVIFYKEGFTYDFAQNDYVYNVTLITGVEQNQYFDRYLARIL